MLLHLRTLSQRNRLRLCLASIFCVAGCAASLGDGGDAVDREARGSSSTIASALSLPPLNVDIHQTSTSGLSSGAFMAVQMHLAHSSIMRGAAVFAGGPYDCAEGSLSNAVTHCQDGVQLPAASHFVQIAQQQASAGSIDPVSNLASQNVFLFGGADDTTVVPATMDNLSTFYKSFITSGTVVYDARHAGTSHTMPTLSFGTSCDVSSTPYLGKCNYDGAGKALAQIYGTLNARATTLGGSFVTMNQADFIASPGSHSLAATGFAYIPADCSAGAPCKVHVAFHGCLQNAGQVGDAYYKNAGYNEWADTNHIVVLYPQTVATSGSNPNACWDWWGYDSPNYINKSGPQIQMVRKMIDTLAAGSTGTDAGTTDAAPPADSGTDAAPVDAGTTAVCFTASNFAHVQAGRAHDSVGNALANGSNQNMGLDNVFFQTTLKQTGPNFYVIGTCP